MQLESKSFRGGMSLSTLLDRATRSHITPALVIILGVALIGLMALTSAPMTLAMTFQAHNAAASLRSSTATMNQKTSQAIAGQATTCATDLTGALVCSTSQYVTVETRSNGKSVFGNVSGSLLFVSQCINGHLTRTPLFDSSLQNYFWSYDNNGLKLLQLRFYQLPTTVAASGTVC